MIRRPVSAKAKRPPETDEVAFRGTKKMHQNKVPRSSYNMVSGSCRGVYFTFVTVGASLVPVPPRHTAGGCVYDSPLSHMKYEPQAWGLE